MKKIFTLLFGISITCLTYAQQAVYVTSQSNEPWYVNTNIDLMDSVFGVGQWKKVFYENVNPDTIFNLTHCFIFMDGSDGNDTKLNGFLTVATKQKMENWVSVMGGRLFMNSAGNTGTTINCGFNGCKIVNGYYASTARVAPWQGLHPVFNGPRLPIGAQWTGGSFAHDSVYVPGGTVVIRGDQGAVLSELKFGTGKVLFGGMTMPDFHQPSTEAFNLRKNILFYLKCNDLMSVEEQAAAPVVSVYPNPFHSSLNINIAAGHSEVYRIGLFDVLGNLVKSISTSESSVQLDATDLPKGMYFYTVTTAKEVIANGKVLAE